MQVSRWGNLTTEVALQRIGNFREIFELLRSCIVRHGHKVPSDSDFAYAVSPEATPESARAMWSLRKRGLRKVTVQQLEDILNVIDKKCGLKIKDEIEVEQFFYPIDNIYRVFISRGIVDANCLPDRRALSEKLAGISSTEDLFDLLRSYRRTYETVNEFDVSLHRLAASDQSRIGELLYRIVECNLGVNSGTVSLASVMISRIAPALQRSKELMRFNARLEKVIDCVGDDMVSIIEPLSFIAMLHGSSGPFIKNITKMITNPYWRNNDNVEQLRYYGNQQQAAFSIYRHLQSRPKSVHAQDIGRVISLYHELINKGNVDLAMLIKDKTMEGLKEIEMSKLIRRLAEDIIEAQIPPCGSGSAESTAGTLAALTAKPGAH